MYICKIHGVLAASGVSEDNNEIICNVCCEPIVIVPEVKICKIGGHLVQRNPRKIREDIGKIMEK